VIVKELFCHLLFAMCIVYGNKTDVMYKPRGNT